MKKLLLTLLFIGLFCSIGLAEVPFHIGIVTGTVSQMEDAHRAAEHLLEKYGDVSEGGMILHITSPDNFMKEQETTISQIVGLADDPKLKAIVVNPSYPGVTEAFRRVREIRPDIILFAGSPQEDPLMITETADLAFQQNYYARGYLLVKASKDLGAEKFVHVTFPRHMSIELMVRMRDIAKAACEDLGMEFISKSAPDPLSEVGIAGAQQYLIENVPNWINEYGKDTNFFTTNFSLEEPIIRGVAKLGAFYVSGTTASPTVGFPGALGVEFKEKDKGNFPSIVKTIEKKIIEIGNPGRMGCWVYPYNFVCLCGLAEHAINVINGESELLDKNAILDAFSLYSPDANWNSTYYVDPDNIKRKNYLLGYQDTYIFGKGFLRDTSMEIPEKYFDPDIGR